MEFLFNGTVGIGLLNWAFIGSALSAVAHALSARGGPQAAGWRRIGTAAFVTHGLSVASAIAVLLGMIITKQYQYQYVYSHSSNELPLHYVVACLWEGQEGSFLLWMFWHAVLGLIALRYVSPDWRPGVVGVVAAVQTILASMVLGVNMPAGLSKTLYSLAVLLPAAWLARQYLFPKNAERGARTIALAAGGFALMLVANTWLGHSGFATAFGKSFAFTAEASWAAGMSALAIGAYYAKAAPFGALAGAAALLALGLPALFADLGAWKIGSSPFLLLREARPDAAIFQVDPDFIPANGTGLNPLLQNYWMVIHPPTLFLGFASTVMPFAFAAAALLSGRLKEWTKPAAAWSLFSAMILGVGILMGGYWAYETLNFGGYWNWDPVENASLAPWLTGVAAVHALHSYNKGKRQLRAAYVLAIVTFILVLYSTFLTRSGILGETSVHSFTDLGLSGQLLVLLLGFTLFIKLALVRVWPQLESAPAPKSLWSRDVFLLLAALTLAFAAVEISFFTSLPVINKIFGTNMAPPANIQQFYYKWNIWIAVAIAALSGTGQLIYWVGGEGKKLSRAALRPFAAAAVAGAVVLALLAFARWDFAWHEEFRKQISGGAYGLAGLLLADELALFAALFTIFANLDVFFRLIRRKAGHLRLAGGAMAHIGFGLLILGALFSSGYEDVVTVNVNAAELKGVFEDDKSGQENILLPLGRAKEAKDYKIRYLGRVEARPPIEDVKILQEEAEWAKIGFTAQGERYAMELPARFFRRDGGEHRATPAANRRDLRADYDLDKVKFFIENQLELIKPDMMNQRAIYAVQFVPLKDTSRSFILFPEAELSENAGIISHPDHKSFPDGDLYVHVSSIPKAQNDTWELLVEGDSLTVGDTLRLPGKPYSLLLERVARVQEAEKFSNTAAAAQLHVKILTPGKYYTARPIFLLDEQARLPIIIDSYEPALGLRVSFIGVAPDQNKVVVRVLQKQPGENFITLRAITKPYINVMWIGALIMTLGFLTAILRRAYERRKSEAEPDRPDEPQA